eukprot:CAMPEP_0206212602 /NCGR_PEP_ID=MMETSP0047_2-20121206/662_1 /ASSEMBLY_ACC=CAM_ASM_000192 /TAXON_ID=195065 /ORGANISM="Chroomonas mesostigmatica_cf, Strain CCMP1168" /LENGTH=100 /DNA_ID=CAMNT_0053634667 /DNA_START=189 /DNA_END=491 /DNA_ORIENTATION=-
MVALPPPVRQSDEENPEQDQGALSTSGLNTLTATNPFGRPLVHAATSVRSHERALRGDGFENGGFARGREGARSWGNGKVVGGLAAPKRSSCVAQRYKEG